MLGNKMDWLTPNAKRALTIARNEAGRIHDQFVETEHLLKGLLRDESGAAARVLRDMDFRVSAVEAVLKERASHNPKDKAPHPVLHDDIKSALESAAEEAQRMGHRYIGTEHLLLGLIAQVNESSIAVLKQFNIDPEQIRQRTMQIIEEALVRPKHFVAGVEIDEKTEGYLLIQASPYGPRFRHSMYWYHEKEMASDLRRLLAIARIQAERIGGNSIWSEHLLLAFILDEHNFPAKLLREAGINPRETVEKIVERISSLEAPIGEIDLSTEIIGVLGFATAATLHSPYNYPLGEHMLLGLLLHKNNAAVDILKQQNIDLVALEKSIRESLM